MATKKTTKTKRTQIKDLAREAQELTAAEASDVLGGFVNNGTTVTGNYGAEAITKVKICEKCKKSHTGSCPQTANG